MGAIGSFVPVDQVIATANSLSESADHIDRTYIKEWISLGLKEIGPTTAWLGEATIYPTDYTLRKPADLYDTIDLALYDIGGNELRYTMRGRGRRIHQSENTLINAGQYEPDLGAPIDVSEDQYYYHLGTNSTTVSYALVKYLRFPTDENGDMLIPDTDVFALAIFCKYCQYMRKDDKTGMGMMHNRFVALRNELRATHATPSQWEATQVARSWNSMIQKARFKTF